jgi:hypothetical protein
MSRYIRFHTSVQEAANSKRLGLFRAFGELESSERLDPNFASALRDTLAWFNAHLRVPSLHHEHHRAQFWFRSEAQDFVRRVWDVVAILRESQVIVELHRSDNPGKIIYRDDHQVAAIPTRRRIGAISLFATNPKRQRGNRRRHSIIATAERIKRAGSVSARRKRSHRRNGRLTSAISAPKREHSRTAIANPSS